jgi:cytochrome d ubiquinol oxidase subunit I
MLQLVFLFPCNGCFWLLNAILFILATWAVAKRNAENKPWLLKYALFALPLPWIAAQTGWYVAEGGRQPWSIGEILPTHSQLQV